MLPKLFIWVLIWGVNFEEISTKKEKAMQVRRFQSCPEYADLPMMLTHSKKKAYANNTHNVEMTFVVKKQIESILEGKFNLWKCDLSGTPDTCEYIMKDFKLKQICKKMLMKDQVWSNFIEGFNPRLICPIRPGTYEVSFMITEEIFKFFPLPRGVWKSKSLLNVGDELVLCFEGETRVIERQVQ